MDSKKELHAKHSCRSSRHDKIWQKPVMSKATHRPSIRSRSSVRGYPVTRELREAEVWQIVPAVLKQRGVFLLHFDEVGHVLQCHNPVEIQKVRNTFKALMQSKDWPVLILSGTPDIAALTQDPADEQVWRRALPLYIQDIDLAKDAELVRNAMLGLGRDKGELDVSSIADDFFIARLIHAAINRLGIVIELIQDAVENALHRGAKRLEVRHFAEAYDRRTGCDPNSNVFTQDNWEKIDPRLALRRRDGELYAPLAMNRSRSAGGASDGPSSSVSYDGLHARRDAGELLLAHRCDRGEACPPVLL
jgi:hypothetical protein